MARRTQKQIKNDYKMIKEVSEKATSMKELSDMTGLSCAQIKTCLAEHPIVERRIKEQLRSNAKNTKLKKEAAQANAKKKKSKESITNYVIDASVTGTENIKEALEKILTVKNSKIVLTSITIKELNNIEKYPQTYKIPKDLQSKDATYISNLAIENADKFENVLIDEIVGIPDDCIIKYCVDNKENVVLLTGDKEMCLKARMYGVHVEYFKKLHDVGEEGKHTNATIECKNLWDAKKIGNDLLIYAGKTKNKSICVYSNSIKYETGTRSLQVGDDVYVSVNRDTYVTFAHYRITSLESINNCELIYYKRIYDEKELSKVANSFYKSFIKDFITKINS